jgi:hypothetical protein
MTRDRAVLSLLAGIVAWLLYRDIAAEREYRQDREAWWKAMEDYASHS